MTVMENLKNRLPVKVAIAELGNIDYVVNRRSLLTTSATILRWIKLV